MSLREDLQVLYPTAQVKVQNDGDHHGRGAVEVEVTLNGLIHEVKISKDLKRTTEEMVNIVRSYIE